MPKKLSTEEFIDRSIQKHGNRYDYSKVNYINAKTKIHIICKTHGSFLQNPFDHLYGKGCPKCKTEILKNFNRLDTKEFIKRAINIHKNKYDYSKVNYINSITKVCIICKKHGEFWQTPNNHLRKRTCPKCANKIRNINNIKSKENFIQESKKIHGKYDYSKINYIDRRTKIEIVCPKHGSFWQTPDKHLNQKQGCPKCMGSKGQLKIMNFLTNHKILFESEKTFSNCKNQKKLRFDFYLPHFNCCIEYDGEGHFFPVKFSDKMTDVQCQLMFQRTIKNDSIKNKYCKKHNIYLIRIPYTDYKNIENILNKELNKIISF